MPSFFSTADEFPLGRDHVSPEWVGRCLQRWTRGPNPDPGQSAPFSNAVVADVSFRELPEKGQTADGFIVDLDYAERPDGAPQTLFVKIAPRDDRHRLQVHDLGLYARELSFYRDFGMDPGIAIPVVYYANITPDTGHFVLLMENLNEDYQPGDMWQASLERVESAVDALAGFHAHWWQHARVLTSRWLSRYDALNHFETEVAPMLGTLSKLVKRKYGEDYDDYLQYVVEHLDGGWSRLFSAEPFDEATLLHGDFHPKELFFRDAGTPQARVVASDWQSTCIGSPGVDLHRVMLAALDPDQMAKHQERLLTRYIDNMASEGIAIEAEALRFDTRRSMLFAIRNWLFSVAFTDTELLEQSAAHAGADFRQRIFRDFSASLELNVIHELLSEDDAATP